jgi:hypothetical protein
MSKDLAPEEARISRSRLELVVREISAEHDRLHALAIALLSRVRPHNESDPEDGADLHAWRLAQILEERLESTQFVEAISGLLLEGPFGVGPQGQHQHKP